MKNKYLVKIPGLTSDEQTKFIFSNLQANLKRLRIAGLVFLIIELFMLILTLLPDVLNLDEKQKVYYLFLYLVIIPFLLLFLLTLQLAGKKLKYKNMTTVRIFMNTGMMLVLIWSVCIILFGYENGFLPNAYILVIISIAVIPFLNFREIISIFIPSQTLLTIYVLVMHPFTEGIATPLLLDSWSFIIISAVISVLFYRLRINDFKKDQQLIKQNNLLKQHSEVDVLTDVFNRRKLDEVMEEEWKRSSRSGKPFSFLLIDLDHFKNFNDTYGHIEGDLCLRKAAAIMKGTLGRSSDSIFRYGGEEFAVILPFTSLDAADIVAEKLRKNIENSKIIHEKSNTGVLTISIGITSSLGNTTTDFKSMYIESDKALYAAKKSGRNMVIAYDG